MILEAYKSYIIEFKAGWQSGYAEDCKSLDADSIPTPASTYAQVAELVDARDLKSLEGNFVTVRLRPCSPGRSKKANETKNIICS